MLIALLVLVAALQTTPPAPVQNAVLTPPRPTATAPAVASSAAPPAPAPQTEVEPESVVEEVKTRQVCRYVDVPGRRFPERRCRTVVIEPDDR